MGTHMRAKRMYRRLSHEDAVAIVKAYHLDGRSQVDIANERDLDRTYVHLIVHGEARAAAFDEVFPGAR